MLEVELVEGRGHPGQKSWILKFEGIDSVEEVCLVSQTVFNFYIGFHFKGSSPICLESYMI